MLSVVHWGRKRHPLVGGLLAGCPAGRTSIWVGWGFQQLRCVLWWGVHEPPSEPQAALQLMPKHASLLPRPRPGGKLASVCYRLNNCWTNYTMPNPALNLAPFSRWTLRDKAAQRRLALRQKSKVSCSNSIPVGQPKSPSHRRRLSVSDYKHRSPVLQLFSFS